MVVVVVVVVEATSRPMGHLHLAMVALRPGMAVGMIRDMVVDTKEDIREGIKGEIKADIREGIKEDIKADIRGTIREVIKADTEIFIIFVSSCTVGDDI